jgi:hypothetical protein
MTEARTCLGLSLSLAGRISQALVHLKWVESGGDRLSDYYPLAVSEIHRIRASGKKPYYR